MTEKLERFVGSWWPVIVAVVLIASAWGASTAQLSWIQDGNKAISAKIDKVIDMQAKTREDIAAGQADGRAVWLAIADLRERLREQRR